MTYNVCCCASSCPPTSAFDDWRQHSRTDLSDYNARTCQRSPSATSATSSPR